MRKLVYLDLDGVLFDLHAALVEFTGIPFPMENRDELFKTYLPDFVDYDGFSYIPVLKNAHKLVDGILAMDCNVAILTSGGSFYPERGIVAEQKKFCIDNNFPELIDVPFCITSSGASKAKLAHSNAFLIDDHTPNIYKFIEAGGYGLIYDDHEYEAALAQVRSFLDV
jgi:hypothetical protein